MSRQKSLNTSALGRVGYEKNTFLSVMRPCRGDALGSPSLASTSGLWRRMGKMRCAGGQRSFRRTGI